MPTGKSRRARAAAECIESTITWQTHRRFAVAVAVALAAVVAYLPGTVLAQAGGVVLPPGATANQVQVAQLLGRTCTALVSLAQGQATLTPGQQDLLRQCAVLTSVDTAPSVLTAAYGAITGQQVNALGPQTKKFATLAQDNLASRLAEIHRGGRRGASVAGLTVTDADGAIVAVGGPGGLASLLPGGASGDDANALLDSRFGLFVNGNVSTGHKGKSKNSYAFDISSNSLTIGADYQVSEHFVVGGAFSSGQTKSDFGAALGRVDLNTNGFSAFASYYRGEYYVDLMTGIGSPRVEEQRHINFVENPGTPSAVTIDQTTDGVSRSREFWAGLSAGRAFHWKALSLTPEFSLNYHQTRIDAFSETVSAPSGPGAGLALAFGAMTVPSLQERAGLNLAYTISTPIGILMPTLHADYVRELRNNSDSFTAHFVNSPTLTAETPALIHTDTPESHYTANGGGITAQFVHGISGFANYEQLRTLKTIKKHEFAFGIRFQSLF